MKVHEYDEYETIRGNLRKAFRLIDSKGFFKTPLKELCDTYSFFIKNFDELIDIKTIKSNSPGKIDKYYFNVNLYLGKYLSELELRTLSSLTNSMKANLP